jgi:hypothetical protein
MHERLAVCQTLDSRGATHPLASLLPIDTLYVNQYYPVW